MTDLRGKLALVTGGSRGLGKEIALRLAGRGADVVLTYRKEKDLAEAVAAAVRAAGCRAAALPVDLDGTADLPRFLTDLETAVTGLRGEFSLDILVANAGLSHRNPIGRVTEEEYDAIMNTNVKSVFFLTQALLPKLADGGRIVLIGSGLTRFSMPPYIVYAASKAAQTAFARYMAKTLGPRRITANVVAPGALHTDFNAAYYEANPHLVETIAANTALGRVGMPEDVGGVVAFLATDDAAWITGQRIEVSGGMSL